MTVEPVGETDPAQADAWAKAATTALDATAPPSAAPAPAPVADTLRPEGEAAELPKVGVPAAPALPAAGPAPVSDAEAAGALDLNMRPTMPALLSGVLGPAAAASSAYAADLGSVRSATGAELDRLQADTTSRQHGAATAADLQIADLHQAWATQRATVVTEHKAGVLAESGRARSAAAQTIAEANRTAKAKVDDAESARPEGEKKSAGWWGKLKSAGNAALGAVTGLASSVLSGITALLAAARQKVVGMLTQLADGVRRRVEAARQTISAVAQRAWSAMATAVRTAQALVTKLAAAAAAQAKKLWEAAKSRLGAAWNRLTAAVRAAFNAAKAVVTKIASALGTLKEILKILKSGALGKLFGAANDPQKLAQPIVDKASPLVGQIPGKADEAAQEKAREVAPPGSGAPVQRLAVQRAPDTPAVPAAPEQSGWDMAGDLVLEGRIRQPEPVVPAAPPGEGFWGGVGRHMKATGNHFLQNWLTTLINLVYSLLLFYPVLLQEGPKLWEECKGVAFGGGGVDRFDHVLGVLRRLVNIVGGLVATTGIWALIIGAFSGPGEVFVAGAFYTVSAVVIGADLTLMLAEVSKAWWSASRPETPPQQREHYLAMGSGSIIATVITGVLIALGVIASRLAGKFRLRGGSKPPPPETKPPETKPAETKPAETKPAETKPAETKPAETKPAETKPAEEKTPENQPSDPAPPAHGPNPADMARAAAERDALGQSLKRKHATYAGGTKDGKVVAGKSTAGACAEDDIASQLGKDANMTGAKGWRRNPATGELEWRDIPVCKRCQGKYNPSQFPPDVKADPGGPWNR